MHHAHTAGLGVALLVGMAVTATAFRTGGARSSRMAVDLTPAVERLPRIPGAAAGALLDDDRVLVRRGGAAPTSEDPFKLVKEDLVPFSDNMKELVETDNPVLTQAAKLFFEQRHGKRFRPTLVALMSKATLPEVDEVTYAKQGQLGQITEMIHVASLIHDDVLDEADTRRGGLAVHKLYSNKVAVLAGDFLLARASVLLARLNHLDVVELMASALDSLVQGELLQVRSTEADLVDLQAYLRKSYYKTASLVCNSCKSAALLAGYGFDDPVASIAEQYGYHLGLAYQVVDDILDLTGVQHVLGKPALADMSLGLATAPILYAMEREPKLKPIIQRRFKKEGDKEVAYEAAMSTDAIERSYELAEWHAQQAVDAVMKLPPSPHRTALVAIAHIVLNRDK